MRGRLVSSRKFPNLEVETRRWLKRFGFSVRKAVLGMMAVHRLQDAMGQSASQRAEQDEKTKLRGEVEQYKREAEEVSIVLSFVSAIAGGPYC